MIDTQRKTTDTSQKLAIRYGYTIKEYAFNDKPSIYDLKIIPLVLAGWIRHLMGVDDNKNTFKLSPDPLDDELYNYI